MIVITFGLMRMFTIVLILYMMMLARSRLDNCVVTLLVCVGVLRRRMVIRIRWLLVVLMVRLVSWLSVWPVACVPLSVVILLLITRRTGPMCRVSFSRVDVPLT